jgi:hypothetical protein
MVFNLDSMMMYGLCGYNNINRNRTVLFLCLVFCIYKKGALRW